MSEQHKKVQTVQKDNKVVKSQFPMFVSLQLETLVYPIFPSGLKRRSALTASSFWTCCAIQKVVKNRTLQVIETFVKNGNIKRKVEF